MATTEPSAAPGGSITAPEAESLSDDPALLGGNELVANSLGEYATAQWKKIRSGESGALPVIIGLIVIIIVFQAENSKFLSAGNLVNLIDQGAVYVLLGMGETFVLLLGDIDLSLGFNMGVGAIITAWLAAPPINLTWILAALAGIAVCAAIAGLQGAIIVRLGLPSFIVTLAGYLGLQGVIIYLLNTDPHASGGNINVSNKVINDIINGSLSTAAGWIVMVVVVVLVAALWLVRDQRRRSNGLVTPPLALTALKIVAIAVAGVVLVLVCNTNRGFFTTISGVPWVVPLLLAVLALFTFLLTRLRLGRYIYAIGGNAEAARRAGIGVRRIRFLAFVFAGVTAGIAGIVYESQLGSISSNVDGGTYVLYAVAAAVIGGTSLFGGRGKMVNALLGGLVIAAIANGLGLIGLSADAQDMVNALVLLAAVTVDALARRGRTA
jgi:D-xylose transport system permease protein